MTVREELNQIAHSLESLNTEISKLKWALYTTGLDFGVNKAMNDKQIFLKDKNNFTKVKNILNLDLDASDKRRTSLLYQQFKPFHLNEKSNEILQKIVKKETQLGELLSKFRFNLKGKSISSVDISHILSEEKDSNIRKEAYLAYSQVNQPLVDAGFIDLLNLRKEYAYSLNESDFVELKLKDSELSIDLFSTWKKDCKKYFPNFQKKLSELSGKFLDSDYHPWNRSYLATKVAPLWRAKVDMNGFLKHIDSVFSKYGYNIGEKNLTFDIFPRKNKSEWGYNFTIEVGRDSRILANSTSKLSDYWTLFHEAGHGIHFTSLDPNDPAMNLGVSDIVAEGFADFFGNLTFCDESLLALTPNPQEAKKQLNELQFIQEISGTNSFISTLFDHGLYRHDIKSLKDINQLYSSIENELLNYSHADYEPIWGRVIHHTTHPIYLHNYLMGDVMFSALMKKYCNDNEIKDVQETPHEFGNFMSKNLIHVSGRYTFSELYEKLVKDDFSLTPYFEKIANSNI